MLAQQLRRIKRCEKLDDIVIATTDNTADDPVADLARRENVDCFRGSELDVLHRFVGAAQQARADVIVRLTADCPLADPGVIDRVVAELVEAASECDYASNVLERTYPRGLDTEVVFRDTLERTHRMANSPAAREHVTTFIYSERPDLFLRRSVRHRENHSDLRWTVDVPVDLQVVRTLYRELGLADTVRPYEEIVQYAIAHPDLAAMNVHSTTWEPPR